MRHFSPADHGNYYDEAGTLLGNEAADVMAWAAAHPDYLGAIHYERWDFEGSVDTREFFYDPDDQDVAAMITHPAATVARSVDLLTSTMDALRRPASLNDVARAAVEGAHIGEVA